AEIHRETLQNITWASAASPMCLPASEEGSPIWRQLGPLLVLLNDPTVPSATLCTLSDTLTSVILSNPVAWCELGFSPLVTLTVLIRRHRTGSPCLLVPSPRVRGRR